MNKNDKTPPKEWIKRFAYAIVAGVFIYFIAIKLIFKPDFSQLWFVGKNIILNLGTPYLKFKAYLCLVYALTPLIMIFLWWLFYRPLTDESYGNAEFAKLEGDDEASKERWKSMNLSKEKGLMLGCFIKQNAFSKKEERTFIRALSPLACLVVAPPGTGKTASIALPNLYSLPNSVVVLDIKGELYEKSAGYRQKHFNNKILLFSPFSEENTMFFNPFDEKFVKDMNFSQMKKLAEQIAGTIFVGEKGKENDHWIVSARTMFVYFALYNMQKKGYTNLAELSQAPKKDYYDELKGEFKAMCQKDDPDTDKKIKDPEADTLKPFFYQASQDEDIDELVSNQFRAYTTAAEQEFASVKSTYDTFMKVFSDPQVAKAVSSMNFNYEDLREEKISMYIVIQTADMDILAPLVRILMESLFKNLMMKENSDPNKFIYFMLDEFVRFGKMPFLLEAPALCRSYGLIPIYITQSYEQIKKYYGDDDMKIIKANVGYQVIFRMNSPEDAKVLSEMIGDYTRKKTSRSKGNLDLIKSNDSVSNEGYKLVTVQDILSNPVDQIYILIGGYFNRPIKAKVNFWFKNPQWQGADKIKVDENYDYESNKEENKAAEESIDTEANKDENTQEKANNNTQNNTQAKEDKKDNNKAKDEIAEQVLKEKAMFRIKKPKS